MHPVRFEVGQDTTTVVFDALKNAGYGVEGITSARFLQNITSTEGYSEMHEITFRNDEGRAENGRVYLNPQSNKADY